MVLLQLVLPCAAYGDGRADVGRADLTASAHQCGSGLARESGVPARNYLTDPPLSRASPLPH
ncbi:hypothetical protein FJD34_09510 [Pseudomonas brenneri]|uniref:Uncharacterized protein n=1 Tax=Pseudomonas brenneri TaxID=129817 RepID=A0A5B2V0B4_9PSED|nr:hypothetical protein [Pseudomonas brenneri]KAA2231577.1 hypothetical protein F1720_05755 [Pseudomonas brenneri]TWR79203.1 hypothetical protein FJD34_09510 [Pseudomonas brenneri]